MASVQRKFRHVLDGYKVLDFTQFVAGPTVTRLMATMGAEVIKVELAPDGDRARLIPYVREKRSGYYVQHNLGKMSLCIDPRRPEGATILRELVKKVDVPVENFAPGTIARLGFGYPEVSNLNPPIVMCSVSTFGQTGPLATDPGFDPIGQAYAGITGLIGEKDGPPVIPPMAIGDVSTGVHGMERSHVLCFIASVPASASTSTSRCSTPISATTTWAWRCTRRVVARTASNVRAATTRALVRAVSSGANRSTSSSSLGWTRIGRSFAKQSAILNLRAPRVSSICRPGSKTEMRW